MKVFTFDIETYPDLFVVVATNCDNINENHVLSLKQNETQTAKKTTEFFQKLGVNMLVSYNGLGFDEPVINYVIAKNPSIKMIHDFANIYFVTFKSDAQKAFIQEFRRKRAQVFKSAAHLDILLLFNRVERTSLKRLAVSMNWPLVQDLPYSPGSLVAEYEQEVIKYCINDTKITTMLYYKMYDEIVLRFEVGREYNIDVLNTSRSVMGAKLMEKMYLSKNPDISSWDLQKERTYYDELDFNDVVSSRVVFKTAPLQKLLAEIKDLKFIGKDNLSLTNDDLKWEKVILIGKTSYTMALGGLHSNHEPEIIYSGNGQKIIDADVASYYPYMMIQEEVYPFHLGFGFLGMYKGIVSERIAAKRAGIKIKAEALKITANAIFGKMGSDGEWFFDLRAMYRVTLNGQLFLLMLIEELTLAGIDVFYGNTDGITAIVKDHQADDYKRICDAWQKNLGLELEFVEIEKIMIRDVNNYTLRTIDGKIKEKGDFLCEPSLGKQVDSQIVPKAIKAWFYEGIPLSNTILNGNSIADYVMTVKIGEQFKPVFVTLGVDKANNPIKIETPVQRVNRYYAAKGKGAGTLFKIKKATNSYHNLLTASQVALSNDWSLPQSTQVNYQYYITRATKFLHPFITTQTSLFS